MKAKILLRSNGILKLQHPAGHTSWGYCKEIAGHKYRASGYRTRKKAEDALDALKYRQHLVSIGAPLPPEAISFKQLCTAYLEDAEGRGVSPGSIDDTRRVLDRFATLLPRRVLVTSITAEHLRQYRTIRRDAGLHAHSLLHELKRIRTVLLAAARLFDGLNWSPPRLPEVKRVHKGRKVVLSEQQIGDLLAAAKPELRDLIVISLHTALRVGEVLNLTRESIDFSTGIDSRFGRLRLISEKSGTEDVLPLTEEAATILQRRLEKSEQAFAFDYFAARRAFKRACKKAKIAYGYSQPGGCVIHTLRHSVASYLLNRGVPLNVVQAICRHTEATMTLVYTHAQPSDIGAAIKSLGGITKSSR